MDILRLIGELHGLVFTLVAIVIVYSDHEAFKYFRGKKDRLSRSFIAWSHRLVWAGLVLMITTGGALAIPRWTFLLQEPAFYVKMGFVLVLIVNAFAIGKLSYHATERAFAELAPEEKRTLMISGAFSAASWIGAAIIGLLFL